MIFEEGSIRGCRMGHGMKWVLTSWIFALQLACAQVPVGAMLHGDTNQPADIQAWAASLQPGTVVVIGEGHGQMAIADQQVQVLQALRLKGHQVSVGMEFFEYPDQSLVDQWRQGSLTTQDFLQKTWSPKMNWKAYERQALFPQGAQARTLALNIPRSISSSMAQGGIQALSPQQMSMLPPDFTLGNEKYFQRFQNLMKDHVKDPAKLRNYFASQSLWDDTMAWKAAEFQRQHPDQILVVIIGEAHVQYGGGFPDRLRQRGVSNISTISQVNLWQASVSEQWEMVRPDPVYGPRADLIFTSSYDEMSKFAP